MYSAVICITLKLIPWPPTLPNSMTDTTKTNCITSKIWSDIEGKQVSRRNYGNPLIISNTLAVLYMSTEHDNNYQINTRGVGRLVAHLKDTFLFYTKLAHPETVMSCIREVPGSIFCRDTDYFRWKFPWSSTVPSCKYRDSASISHDRWLPNLFQI